MPRKPIDYSKGLIYKIVCKDLNIKKCYYGSTTDLRNRKYGHKYSCNNVNDIKHNCPIYKYIRDNGGWDNWNIILIKKYPCNSKLELEREERRCMEKDHNRLNNNLPTQTQKEYHKQYNIDNRDKLKKYYKQYLIVNADKKKQWDKQYYIDNADKIKQRKQTLITCECGCVITKGAKSNHLKSKKHKKMLNQNYE